MASIAALPLPQAIEYPESDGEPMAETDLHRDEMGYLIDALDDHFRDRPDVYVSGNLFLYYRQGDRRACVAPDLFVVRGVAKRRRNTYLLWEEGVAPCLVVEVTSKGTRDRDEEKADLYARLGVEEYLRFDPMGEYLRPRLQGFRLRGHDYRRLRPAADGSLRSRTLGVSFRIDADGLRLADTGSGEPLLRAHAARQKVREEEQARREAENEAVLQAARAVERAARAAQEAAARQAADERAAQEAAARQAADERAAQEAAARQTADERAARLEAELARIERSRHGPQEPQEAEACTRPDRS